MNAVSQLLAEPFSQKREEVKLDIKMLGRPCPVLNIEQNVKSSGMSGRTSFHRSFSVDYYNKFDWLCGCEVKNKLFCFPCVLYRGETMWSTEGFSDLNHLSDKAKKHERSSAHMSNVTSLAFLGKNDILGRMALSDAYKKSVIDHNKKVDDNRYVFNIIINCIKFCGCFELALGGQDSLNPGVFRGLINFSAELDAALKIHLEKSTLFTGLSKRIQNDILECMLTVCQDEIKNEINSADHFAVIADETSDVSNTYQMAVVFRYLVKGQPVERFFEFLHPSDHDSESLARAIMSALAQISDSKKKLVAQTYDGASVSCEHRGVHTRIKEHYPLANFYHCFAHQLNLVLIKAMSINSSVRVFFANLTGLCAFFSQSPQHTSVLDEVVKRRLPQAVVTGWNINTRPVNTVFESKDDILQCLKQLRDESLNHATIQQATGFVKVLEDYSFNFWLKFLHPIMLHVDILYNFLQERGVDAVGVKSQIESFEAKVNEMRNVTYTVPETPSKKRRGECEELGLGLRRQSMEVCDLIVMEIKQRFFFTGHLSAANLLNRDKFSSYREEFPHKLLSEVSKIYHLEEARMRTELGVLYNSEEFSKVPNAVDFLQIIVENNLLSTFRETAKLCSLLATSPISSCEAERASCISRVKTFLRNSMGHNRLTALAMLSIEKSLVLRMRDFNARVIDNFAATKDPRIELLYK